MYGLFPSDQITPYGTPELAKAARVTLNRRGDGSTGWSRAWKICFWARLGDGDHAYKILTYLVKPTGNRTASGAFDGGSYPNLFCSHPPFQIDGNFGGCAGIAEMLIQSHAGFIEFLPALPDAWREGNYNGMRVRGGGEVGVQWMNSKINQASIRATVDNAFKVKIPAYHKQVLVMVNKKGIKSKINNGFLTLDLKKGDIAEMVFKK